MRKSLSLHRSAQKLFYAILTHQKTPSAWITVLLYKCRWDIEKVFDELKTKLGGTEVMDDLADI